MTFVHVAGIVSFLLGFVGGLWSWPSMRNGRYLPLSGIVFLISMALVSIGCYIVLPWSIGE
jgi:hypothetical protein